VNNKLFWATILTYPIGILWFYYGVQILAGSFIWFVFTLFLLPFLFIPYVRYMMLAGWNQIFLEAYDLRGIAFLVLTGWIVSLYGVYFWTIFRSRLGIFEKILWFIGLSLLSPVTAPLFLMRNRHLNIIETN